MNLYLAAIHANKVNPGGAVLMRTGEAGLALRSSVRNLLESYHYIDKPAAVAKIRKMGEKVFLDSGAFSAHSLGVDINIDAYCSYIQNNKDIIRVDDVTGALLASVLDGIGSAKLTLENQKEMEAQGVKPLPCFHFGEPEEYLKHYMDNYEYITLGGLVPISTKESIRWLDRIWGRYLADEHGRPRLRVHAFGVTSQDIMKRYPWASVDSSSWVQAAGNGSIYLPYTFKALAVSVDSPSRKTEGQHIDTLPQEIRASVVKDIEDISGLPIDGIREDYAFRFIYNIGIFRHLQDKITAECQRYKHSINELF